MCYFRYLVINMVYLQLNKKVYNRGIIKVIIETMAKVTQKQMVLYKLMKEHLKNKIRFVPAWEFGGEMKISEIGEWVLMSYKCPTRLTDLFQEHPELLEREMVSSKSGAKYYAYRLNTRHYSYDQFLRGDKKTKSFYTRIVSLNHEYEK